MFGLYFIADVRSHCTAVTRCLGSSNIPRFTNVKCDARVLRIYSHYLVKRKKSLKQNVFYKKLEVFIYKEM
jgi:hypothetical protein